MYIIAQTNIGTILLVYRGKEAGQGRRLVWADSAAAWHSERYKQPRQCSTGETGDRKRATEAEAGEPATQAPGYGHAKQRHYAVQYWRLNDKLH